MSDCLIDSFQRRIVYLRLSVTDRCDLRCSYCMPEGCGQYEPTDHWLNFDEIERLVRLFARLGVSRLRLTGGEPLLRRGISELSGRLSGIPGIQDLSLSTNATQLEHHAQALRAAGVSRLNISLDSLRPERIERLTGRDVAPRILRGLDAAIAAGFSPIKINTVVMLGQNDDEIDDLVAYCMQRQLILRLIEPMPVGDGGRSVGTFSLQTIRERLCQRFGLLPALLPGGGPATYLSSPDGRFNLGFITPLSRHFCATCNRVRLTVDGALHLCLGQEDRIDLRTPLRAGASDTSLLELITSAMAFKPERHVFVERPEKIIRFMSATGG